MSNKNIEYEAKKFVDRYFKRIAEHIHESGNDEMLNIDIIHEIHPQLNPSQCRSLLEFANSQTIHLRGCYGDGSKIYPQWIKEKCEQST